jgi:3-hydroxyacyl-[acyl-carrier-protein] dehydratase
MKLKDDFFSVIETSPDKRDYLVSLNPRHEIYRDHFPGNPVTPGVCIIQMIKELASLYTGRELFMRQASKIRYFKVINPTEHERINVSLDIVSSENNCKVAATVSSSENTFARLSLDFSMVIQ